MELKGSKTEHNLAASFAGESQARNKYTYFATVAKEEGFEQIAGIFLETAENEREHAKREFDFLKGIRDTKANLKEGKVFKKDKVVRWKCRNCGYVHEGTEAPQECPACGFLQSYYELMVENY